jgi:hypothetical protein
MKKVIRYSLTTIGVIAISLIIVVVVYAFSIGNVDGTWGWADGVAENSTTSAGGGGAYCSRWGTGVGDAVTTWSNWDKAIQTPPITDENQIRYGLHAYSPESGWNCESCTNTDWVDQSGFGFDGNNGPVSPASNTPFFLGKFIHYNKTIFLTDCNSGTPTDNNRNAFNYADLTVTVPVTCNDGTTSSSFSFTPHFVLDETTNTAGQCAYDDPNVPSDVPCPDKVTVTQPGTTATFTCPDGIYTVNILGFTKTGLSGQACDQSFNSASVATEFVTQELQENPACLWAEITAPTADIYPAKACVDFNGADPYYKIDTFNAGPGSAREVTISDVLPNGAIYSSYTSKLTTSSGTVNQGSCTYTLATKTLSCQLLTPLPATSVDPTAKWTVEVHITFVLGDYTNSVTASTVTGEGSNTHSNTASSGDCTPTAVELKSFTAARAKNSILLTWVTASEVDNLGFNLYRAAALGEARVKLNASLVPAMLGSQSGAVYTYSDMDLLSSGTYYYWLEVVNIHGARQLIGPEMIKVLAGKK